MRPRSSILDIGSSPVGYGAVGGAVLRRCTTTVDAGGDSFVAFVLDLAAGGAGAGGDATAGCGFSDSTDGVGNSAETACGCSWSATGRGRGKRWQWVASAASRLVQSGSFTAGCVARSHQTSPWGVMASWKPQGHLRNVQPSISSLRHGR